MLVSVVVSTRNRSEALRRCLMCFTAVKSPGPWELVIVDNGSSDNTSEVVAEFARTAAFRVLLVTEPRRGLGRARNAGIKVSSGDIIAFTDDDCYVSSDYLTN